MAAGKEPDENGEGGTWRFVAIAISTSARFFVRSAMFVKRERAARKGKGEKIS